MSDQLGLFKETLVEVSSKGTNEERFWRFHQANPAVLRALISMTRQSLGRGHKRLGMRMFWESLRREVTLATSDDSHYRLNNIYAPYYARLIMSFGGEYTGIFETRSRSRRAA